MPTRDRASLLRRALLGVRAQTVRETEIIVVDDASTDGTLAMLASEFPHVKVVRHGISRGASAARNSGIAAATGDWIFFHDDDDLMHPSHIADLLSATLEAPPYSLIAGRSRDFAIVGEEVVLGPPVSTAAERSDTDTLIQFLDPNGLRTIHDPVAPPPVRHREMGRDPQLLRGLRPLRPRDPLRLACARPEGGHVLHPHACRPPPDCRKRRHRPAPVVGTILA